MSVVLQIDKETFKNITQKLHTDIGFVERFLVNYTYLNYMYIKSAKPIYFIFVAMLSLFYACFLNLH